MKTIPTHCRLCGLPLMLDVEEQSFFSETKLANMAVCDPCFDKLEQRDKIRKSIRELSEFKRQDAEHQTKWSRKPYED